MEQTTDNTEYTEGTRSVRLKGREHTDRHGRTRTYTDCRGNRTGCASDWCGANDRLDRMDKPDRQSAEGEVMTREVR